MTSQDMSDTELIDKLATDVMGWEKVEYPPVTLNDDGFCWKGDKVYTSKWNPLQDWNHTMQLVEKFSKMLFSKRLRFRRAWEQVAGCNMSEALTHLNQREICLAALAATQQTNDK